MNRAVAAVSAMLFVAFSFSSAEASPRSAKDMFFDQLESSSEPINTGFKYWIQLRRNGKVSLVDNRTSFVSGDEIRFQVIPNISGFAYVALAKGSTGQQKVLFPNSKEPNGRVTAGRQVLIPATGYLRFDSNPGAETLRVVVSRKAVSAQALLNPDNDNWVQVAGGATSGNPIQNRNCLVAFKEDESLELNFDALGGKGVEGDNSSYGKDIDYVASSRQTRSRIRVPRNRIARRSTAPAVRRPGNRRPAPADPLAAARRPNAVTVINVEPTENLGADIVLNHL